MNPEHLRAFVWLRWRLLANQLRRGGVANAVILGVLAVLGAVFALGVFAGIMVIGLTLLKEVEPFWLLVAWDVLVVAFLFVWATGLITELQRSEVLSLDKFLHLPVSLKGAFL
ncbi:MAG TPA: hypothetical protein VFW33_22320, partial [Gemmataceae bacterium]|nr:hypothetical protein [Gemmataceae bacterium]